MKQSRLNSTVGCQCMLRNGESTMVRLAAAATEQSTDTAAGATAGTTTGGWQKEIQATLENLLT
jgi:hypothetical protein